MGWLEGRGGGVREGDGGGRVEEEREGKGRDWKGNQLFGGHSFVNDFFYA